MKNIALLASLGLALGASSALAAAPKGATSFPAELRGNWYEADNHIIPMCNNEDQGLLQIEEDEFTFPLEVGKLIRITEKPIDQYRVEFFEHVVTDGPDMPRANYRRHTWTLSHDGEHLNIVAKGMTLDLFRCRPQPTE